MQLHVMTSAGGWCVRRAGAYRAWKRFEAKADAVRFAKEKGDTVYVHRPDGMVERKIER